MNIENIRQLAEVLNQSGLTVIEVSEGDMRIRLEKNVFGHVPSGAAAPAVQTALPVQEAVQLETDMPAQADTGSQVVDFNKLREIKSPMVGLFFEAPAPGSAPFVRKGSKVKKGDVVCIIEAMKMMNEIAAELDGEVVDICAGNGQLVEFSQVLFKIF